MFLVKNKTENMYCIFIFYVPAMILLTHMYFKSCGSKLREMENDHAKTSSTNKIISRAARAKNLQRINNKYAL